MLKKLPIIASLLVGFTLPAHAMLQIAISDGATTFTCADGGGCDFSPSPGILQTSVQVGNFNIGTTFASSVTGPSNLLDISGVITNNGSSSGLLTVIAGDTDYRGPVSQITNVGAGGGGLSKFEFFADPSNQQGAGAGLATPGVCCCPAPAAARLPRHSSIVICSA